MATWSRIGVVLPNGRVKQISCRYDGNLNSLGKKLLKHYPDFDYALALVELGNLVSIENSEGLVVEVARPVVPATEINLKDFPDEGNLVYYAYLYRDGAWWVKFNWSNPRERWKRLTPSLIEKNQ